MITFEEFFKKKKIDLSQLRVAEPVLFAEFEQHYNQMGEKSFDHTKKYWFNPLRRKYHTIDEPKVEKVKMENKLAEQTITESIAELTEPNLPKLNITETDVAPALIEGTPTTPQTRIDPEDTKDIPAPKLGFKPKFKTSAEPIKPVENTTDEQPAEAPAPKLGFKPKFKTSAPLSTPVESNPIVPEEEQINPAEVPAPNLGFKPKFKAAAPKAEENAEQQQDAPKTEDIVEPQPEAKPVYKPKFQARNFKPKTGDE